MAVLALFLTVAWIVLVAGVRSYLQVRRTGQAPILTLAPRRGSTQWWARQLSALGLVLAVAAPVAELVGVRPLAAFDHPAVRVAGVALVILGIALTMIAQLAMGASWRVDVDPDAKTDLVTTGPFRYVRNPIFTATATTVIGLALVVPNVLAAAMVLAVVLALQVQVRLVEEPYLRRVHGEAYRSYAAGTGRFVPFLGRIPPDHGAG